MADVADRDLGILTRLRVLHLDDTDRAKRLTTRWRYYEQRQHDDAEKDFDGCKREKGMSYFETRQRGLGYSTTSTPSTSPLSSRRPSCPTTIAGTVVDTYTAMLLGDGRQPKLRVSADAEGSDLLVAMLDACDAWDAIAEGRKIAGAEGAAGLLPEVIEGELSLRSLRPEDCYVEWTGSPGWVPQYVIEQKRVEIESIDETGSVTTETVWRTRAWDQQYSYIYEDVDEDFGQPDNSGGPSQRTGERDTIELSEAPIPHQAGRCPVIWLQNTRCTEDPIGDSDCEGVYEQIDQLDYLWSMILRGTKSNNDPTLVIKDKMIERRMWPMRAKGHGNKIELSEVGDASLLEMTGKTIETSWLTAHEIKTMIEERTGVVVIRPDQAGALQSGVALQILRGTANNRVAMRRPPLRRSLAQLGRVFLSLARAHKIKEAGTEGKGIALPKREVASEEGEDPVFELPKLGSGNAVLVSWGELHSPTPVDIQTLSQGITVATGGQPVISRETGVALFGALGQTGVDAATEQARMDAEAKTRVASFESSMTPKADDDLDDLIDGEDKPVEGKPTGPVADVQKQALNGAQQQAMMNTFAAAGITLAAEAALFTLKTSNPDLDEAGASAAIAKQIAFAEQMRARQPETSDVAPVPKPAPVVPGV